MTRIVNFDYDVRYWDLSELQAALNSDYSELGTARDEADGEDLIFLEVFLEDRIYRVGTEMRRRIRGGQDLDAARVEARRYPPELIARVKAAYDMRDMVARDLGITGPISGKICSPFRDDRTPSFAVYCDHYYDYGSHEQGDVLTWRMRRHNVSFWQALESLAIQAGIPLPEPADTPRPMRPSAGGHTAAPRALEFRGGKVVTR